MEYLQDNYEQQPQPPPLGFRMPPLPASPQDDFFRFRIDGSDIMEELEHQLKGEVLVSTPTGAKYEKKFVQELTDEGVSDILNIVYSFGLNKNTILGCLTHPEIYERCNSIWKELANYFFIQGEKIGVTRRNRGLLLKKIVFIIHSGLSRSEEGREADQLSSASTKVEHTYTDNSQKSKTPSLGGFMNSWRSRRGG